MKIILRSLSLFLVVLAIALTLNAHRNAHAATFNPGDIISDSLFNEATSMSASQINSFLNGFSGSCISPNNGFSAQDPTGYSPSGGFTYGNNVTAGQVIYDAAQAYNINPQVILATLQKEQSLVDGSGGCSALAYAASAGYGCPDGGSEYSYSGVDLYAINGSEVTSVSGTCVNSSLKAGFSQQVIRAAWLLKFGEQRSEGNVGWDVQLTNYPQGGDVWNNSDDPQSCYGGPMTAGTWQICPDSTATYYDGYTTIDGDSVDILDGATAALYYYTPHFHGNENFFNIFTDWFGDATLDQYPWEIAEAINGNGQYYLVVGNTKRWIPTGTIYDAWGLENYPLQQVSSAYLNSVPTLPNLGNLGVMANGQYVFVDNAQKYNLSSSALADWGINSSAQALAAPVNTILSALPTVGNAGQYIQETGTSDYFLMSTGNLYPINPSYSSSWSGLNPTEITSASLAQFTQTSEINNTFAASSGNYVVDSGELLNITAPNISAAYGAVGANTITVDPSVLPMFTITNGSQLVEASGSSNWELLIDGQQYYVPSENYAADWGYPGSPQIISSFLLAEFPVASSSLGTTVENTTTDNYYLLDGQSHLIPAKFVNDIIGSVGASVSLTAVDDLPTQGFVIYSPIFIMNRTPNVFTFINGSYYYVQTTDILNGLGYPSTYQIMGLTINGLYGITRASTNASQFITSGGVTYYMQNGTAYGLNPTYSGLWTANSTPLSYVGSDFAQRFNVSTSTYEDNISNGSGTDYIVDNGSLINVTSYSDAYGLTSYASLNVTDLPINNEGVSYLARSSTTPSNTQIWLINGGTKQWISTSAEFASYGGNSVPTTGLSDTLLSDIPTTSGSPSIMIGTGSSGIKFLINGQYYSFPNSTTLSNILGSNSYTTVNQSIYNSFSSQAGSITQVLEDGSTHKIYYADDGQLQWLDDAAAYSHYSSIPVIVLPSNVISWFPQGTPISN